MVPEKPPGWFTPPSGPLASGTAMLPRERTPLPSVRYKAAGFFRVSPVSGRLCGGVGRASWGRVGNGAPGGCVIGKQDGQGKKAAASVRDWAARKRRWTFCAPRRLNESRAYAILHG